MAERLILCGGAPAPPGPVPADALRLAVYGPNPSVHLRLAELRRNLWRAVPDVLRDLLDVAAYVYAADQAVPRAERVDGDELGAGWRRAFRFRVPVRARALWESPPVRGALEGALSFLSDDTYAFDFLPLAGETSLDGFIDYGETQFDGADEVALFSGGLDSLAGAAEAVAAGRRPLLVTHRSNEKLNARHAALVRGLGVRAGGRPPAQLPIRINKAKRHGREPTQRTRSFLFAALGAVCARLIGADRLRFYENGITSLNLPLAPQVVGGRASRTTHPRTLAAFGTLFGALFGTRFAVENPFQWDTKTDVVKRLVGADCGPLIAASTSCAHTRDRSARHPHCGACSQCLDRRFAVLAAEQGAHDPAGGYSVDLLTGPRLEGGPRAMLAGFLDVVGRVDRMGQAEFAAQFGEVARALPHLGLPATVGAARAFELYRRHARQVLGVVDGAIAGHATEIRRGALPRTCLLRLVVDGSVPEDESAPAPSEPPAPPEPPPGNRFARHKRFWAVRFGTGELNYYPADRVGFKYLAVLLAQPGRTFTAAELSARVVAVELAPDPRAAEVAGTTGAGGDRGADALDALGREDLEARLAEIRAVRGTFVADTPAGIDAADALVHEERRIAEHLSRSAGRRGRSRKVGDVADRVRNRVCNAVRRALEVVAEDDPPLATHLRDPVLQMGHSLCYRPPDGTAWTVEGV